MSWIDRVTDAVSDVATRLGYEVHRHASASSCKCPVCGSERRHSKSRDRRGAVGMPHSKPQAWHCFQCQESGDAIDFVSHHIGGKRFRELESERKDEVRSWFGFDDDRRVHFPPVPRDRPRELPAQLENMHAEYPPLSEVEAFWESCRPVESDRDAMDYLAWRDIGAARLLDHDCVRVLPARGAGADWARFGGDSWASTGHRLIVPLYDFQGTMRSFVARSIERAPAKKSLGAQGYGRRGLVMAGSYGREMLLTGAQAHWHRLERLRVTVFEGEIDLLRGIANGFDDVLEEDYRPAAFRAALGIFAGSFTRDVAWRVPNGSTIVVATDADDEGDKYAEQIIERIGERCSFERVRMEQDRKAV